MIIEYLQRHAIERPHETFLIDDSATVTFQEAEREARSKGAFLRGDCGVLPDSFVYLYARDSVQLVLTLLASQYCGAKVCILNRAFEAADFDRFARRLPAGLLITDAEVPYWPERVLPIHELQPCSSALLPGGTVPGGIVILTTGTTGLPKAALYTWAHLLSQVRFADNSPNRRWALLYPLNHFAGLQVLLHTTKNGLSLAIPKTRQFTDVLACLTRSEVDSVSATPTFWRMFTGQLTAGAEQLKVRQITLGGEPASADILRRLRELFPGARITQVFATTEIGSCFTVNDGLPGFPAEFLEAPIGNVQLRIKDGSLYIRSGMGMTGYVDGSPAPDQDGDWIDTGDLVELRGNRVFFLGRKGEVINVGGVKVFPPSVEDHIRSIPGVSAVRVYGKPNPVTGQIVAADLEIEDGFDPDSLLGNVRSACRLSLNRYEQPRELHIVNKLSRSNEKLTRR